MAPRAPSVRRQAHRHGRTLVVGAALVALCCVPAAAGTAAGAGLRVAHVAGSNTPVYQLDCNGQSPAQHPDRQNYCTDIRGFAGVDNRNVWGSRFYDNGFYIGHDEPDLTFLSSAKGSGDAVSFGVTIGKDPSALPTDVTPGKDVAHWFELSPAPWISMALCDPESYPQLPCVPRNDANAPAPCTTTVSRCRNNYPGAGSALLELQFYPPGNPPFTDSESCDDVHWCVAITIDSLECTDDYVTCNDTCEEPQNFAFLQTDGVPDPGGTIPDGRTLLMNPGDRLTVQLKDVPAQGGGNAVEAVVDDLTRHTTGYMQASADNGFVHTSIATCASTPYNFQPEYVTAKAGNYVPWTALQTNISTEFETGHFEPCTSLTEEMPSDANPLDSSDPDGATEGCVGPYESESTAGEGAEAGDAMCYLAGDTHPGYAGAGTSTPPDEITGCQDDIFQNGDLDFDGTPYWPEWPTGTSVTSLPSTFLESAPTSGGKEYSSYFFQTDIALSESGCTAAHPTLCTVPPNGPGHFYPYWSLSTTSSGVCTFEFGNVSTGTRLTTFSRDKQYGTVQWKTLGYPEFLGAVHKDTCRT